MQVTCPSVVGRDAELRQLTTHVANTRASRGTSVFVRGEAGIGKSRLIGECVAHAFVTGVPVLRGRASPAGALMPFRPIAEALFSLFRTDGPPDDPALAPYLPTLSRLVPEWRTGEPGQPDSLVVLAESVLRLLAVTGRDRGCLVVLEDLHDADAETLAVVEYLVDNLATQPVLLVASLRPDPGPAGDLAWRTGQRRSADVIELTPLSPPQIRAFAAACLRVDPDGLPLPLVDRLQRGGEGNPLVTEELLRAALSAGVLACDADGCRLVGELGVAVPTSLVRAVTQRADRLGPQVRATLNTAAVLGRRFNASLVQAIIGLDERTVVGHLAMAADAQLVGPDGANPDWYSFRHAVTAEALRASLLPTEAAAIARTAADVLIELHPELPGEWCQLAGLLRATAGDGPRAAGHFAEAGRRALAAGATASAIALLDQALAALPATGRVAERAEVLESLVYALTEAGELDRAFGLADSLTSAPSSAPRKDRRVVVHTRLAWGAMTAGRWSDATAQVAAARTMLGPTAGPEDTVELDVVEAHLLVEGECAEAARGTERTERAEAIARRAVEVAERCASPVAACQGWQLLAILSRSRGFDHAEACLHRMLDVAREYSLPIWRLHAMLRLGVNEAMRTGEIGGLEQALAAAHATGAITLAYTAESSIALESVLRAQYAVADEISSRCAEATARLRHLEDHQFNLLTRAMIAAHQGDRSLMDDRLADFRAIGGEQSLLAPLTHGLCRAICALLEEDRPRALAELDEVRRWEQANPNVRYLAGTYGLTLLLDVLQGRAGRPEYERVAAGAGGSLRWNRQFLHLADAVLLGRAGRTQDALMAVGTAHAASARYPRAHHLGLRLVAEAALDDGWGTPVPWLRSAEEYFHLSELPAVSGACRALLRRGGASAPQRRSGRSEIPPALLVKGLTVREYEVLLLLHDRQANKEIAQRLFISPRTVEKHVASLLTKTGCPDRAALRAYAAEQGLRQTHG
ncbi:helix-turn-helix transcriptional regulator [Krasilnikovia sp. MM14-A1259]|uniref:helix-turn-helix transcriptional regulator n=1 Tax=Krasilnikovia sp. MM14-A1259 TaxID=3373539 RepID=UPI00381A7686